jgi:hypothetical protein
MKLFYEFVSLGLVAACGSLIIIGCLVGEAGLGFLAMAPLWVAALLPQD